MRRESVREDQLCAILSEELHRQDPCGECRFTQTPVPLRTLDESGCNWSQDLILRRGRLGNASCAEAASRVITQVAAPFNLMPSHAVRSDRALPTGRVASGTPEAMRSRETYLYFQIDANRINSRGTLAAMNRLERWHRNGVIGLVMSDVAHAEAKAGGNARRSRKVVGYIHSLGSEGAPDSKRTLAQIAGILF